MMQAKVHQHGEYLTVSIPRLRSTYIDAIMRKNCFPELHELYTLANAPAKEFTESYAALHHLRRSLVTHPYATILHIGDGAHCRTGAMFAFMSGANNISIDPIVNEDVVDRWITKYDVKRLKYYKSKVEEVNLEKYTAPTIVTFVHSHVDTDAVLNRIPNWVAAYVNPCCDPGTQLSKRIVVDEGYDWSILSPERQYQVILNTGVDDETIDSAYLD